ncbi:MULTISPECIES: helix-turn-helix domain-containing protein [Streptomyces]|uniref:helix-turn-helix domain-containing protein n=1 Tax=Streptomyces TaxID=1883 RepID=UPI00163BB870|nr:MULTISPECIES: helix-turn-helix transcriptional regulator [Streptomyces]MBC2875483.1 helix-turn-helix transcriptional regulator [Streptomyces sp. TYQ1024]UBI35723.1 helix-turn-helix domain-containing protein [Streptomyces mobaraensis]UKW28317.1 helix-turn-helix domain-containing protein [Streptomyces sp. TYQ1024]
MGENLGALIRSVRCYLRLSQTQLGQACGYSASAISRIERNKMCPNPGALRLMADRLGIPQERLRGGAVPDVLQIATVAVSRPSDEEDAVRRRKLLPGALAAGATAVVGAETAPATASPGGGLDDALFRLPPAEPMPLPRLAEGAARALAAFRAARYGDLERALPGLLAAAETSRDAASGRAREQVCGVLARSYVVAAELAAKQHSDAGWVAADRALSAARASGSPVPIGEATRVLAITMRRSGRWSSAVRLLSQEAAELDAEQDRTGAVRTTLLLTAAYSAATGGDRSTALALLEEAEEHARRLPGVPGLFTVEASQAQVDVYRIGVFNALGTPDEGVKAVTGLNFAGLPTAERRARAWTDTARMWHALGDGRQTFAALRRVEQEAPQEVRRPALRALTSDLMYGPARLQGLREFAARTGASA